MSQLTLYKASAGSGKTFRLTGEYLKLVLKSVYLYKNILAVTFTNKAADEMKNRILAELHTLSLGNKSAYEKMLLQELDCNSIQLKSKATNILKNVLHDYSHFSVFTIDRFFQKVLRSFAREIGLYSGFSIELDNKKVLSNVIDQLVIKLDQNQELQNWLIEFASNKINEGKPWNFKRDLNSLGYEVFKESFQSFNKQLNEKFTDKVFLKSYLNQLLTIKNKFKNTLKDIGQRSIEIIDIHSLSLKDFPYDKSGFASYFYKICDFEKIDDIAPGKRVLEALNTIEKWYTKKSLNIDAIEAAYHAGLNDNLVNSVEYYQSNIISYISATSILDQLYTLGILTDISSEIKNYTDENNIFLLSDASKLLNAIIGDNDAPFIYEKTGNIYKHFMIDEFQDTSSLQWNNFRPLILNSLSENNQNLIVGDVKQSIYRWRNSDWSILSEQVSNDFRNYKQYVLSLQQNWRSKERIIKFNNSLFHHCRNLLQQQMNEEMIDCLEMVDMQTKILDAYSDYIQFQPENKENHGGYVKLLYCNSKKEEKEKFISSEVPKLIEQLQDRGYEPRDIAILVRSHSEGNSIAQLLLDYKNNHPSVKYKYDIISEEFLRIENSSVIKFIIGLLKYFIYPQDMINTSYLLLEYKRYLQQIPFKEKEITTILHSVRNKEKELIELIIPSKTSDFVKLSLFETTERIISFFKLNEISDATPYLHSFQDIVQDYVSKESSDINSFIDWWDEKGKKQCLSVSEDQDAIRIMTIHKSKGLEFNAVILPYCDWDIDSDFRNIIWCKPSIEPYNQLDLVPVSYKKELATSIFYADYFNEKLKSYVDNLNLLYVALTRAKISLFAIVPKKEKEGKIQNISGLMHHALKMRINEENKSLIQLPDFINSDQTVFEYGTLDPLFAKIDIDKIKEIKIDYYPSFINENKLRLKYFGEEFFSQSDDRENKINYGTLMHEIFRNIKTIEDVGPELNKKVFEGVLTQQQAFGLKEKIDLLLSKEEVKEWFSKDSRIITEKDIFITNNQKVRPDRVIINKNKLILVDYKFGKNKNDSYHKQVEHYHAILEQMDYKKIESYIWYVELNEIEKIKSCA